MHVIWYSFSLTNNSNLSVMLGIEKQNLCNEEILTSKSIFCWNLNSLWLQNIRDESVLFLFFSFFRQRSPHRIKFLGKPSSRTTKDASKSSPTVAWSFPFSFISNFDLYFWHFYGSVFLLWQNYIFMGGRRRRRRRRSWPLRFERADLPD